MAELPSVPSKDPRNSYRRFSVGHDLFFTRGFLVKMLYNKYITNSTTNLGPTGVILDPTFTSRGQFLCHNSLVKASILRRT